VIAAAGTSCRPAAGFCDAAESCSGNAGQACPDDAVLPQGSAGAPTSCSPYVCDGQIGACPNTCTTSADCAVTFSCNVVPGKCQ
jgi:hypothetical protein